MSLKKVRIKSKKAIGVVPVYDICVPDAHHYLLDSGVVSHNSGFIYASSIVVAMKKKKLKDKDLGGSTAEVKGIKAACKVVKSRYSKPFESVDIFIPWEEGMSPYSGLFDLFEKTGLLVKQGNRYRYVSKTTGEEIIEFRKKWESDTELLDQVMAEFSSDDLELAVDLDDNGEVIEMEGEV